MELVVFKILTMTNLITVQHIPENIVVIIAQFRYFNIQFKTIDITTRLQGINPTNSIVYTLEPCTEVYCFRLNSNLSKLGYLLSELNIMAYQELEQEIIFYCPYLCSTPSKAFVSKTLEVLSPRVATGPNFRGIHTVVY